MISLTSLSSRTRLARLSGALAFLLASASPSLAQGKAPASTAAFESAMKGLYPSDKPGATVIVVKDGKTVFRQAYGMADLELGVPMKPEMVLRLGSITKQFTATAILMLAEEGQLSLQDPIEKYLPGYPTHGKVITIEHLLTHTSGIQSYTSIPRWMTDRIIAPMKPLELIDGFKNAPMNFDPGEKFLYNNSGFILLGAIIEKVSGMPYAQFVEGRIFKPLGMTSSYYGDTERILKNRVPGYTDDDHEVKNMAYLSMTQPYAAGSLLSSVDDLAKWDASLYTETLLKKASLQKAWTAYVLKDGKATGYGYGWEISRLQGHASIEHGGGIFGFSTYGVRLPNDHVYVAVLCNSDSPSTDPGYVAKKLAAIAMGKPFPERKAMVVDPKILQRYVGVYRVDPATTRTVTVEAGKLYTQRSGGQRQEVLPASETEFFYDKTFTFIRFVADGSGRVTEMLSYPDGADEAQHAPRTSDAVAHAAVAIKMDPAAYDAYLGDYEIAPTFVLTVTREGDHLITQATGQGKIEIFPSAENEFFVKVMDAQITFVRGADGAVESLVLHQRGRDTKAPKKK